MFWNVAQAAKGAVKNFRSRHSSQLSSCHSDMSVDPPAEQAPSSLLGTVRRVLLKTSDLGQRSQWEKDIF